MPVGKVVYAQIFAQSLLMRSIIPLNMFQNYSGNYTVRALPAVILLTHFFPMNLSLPPVFMG